MIIHRKGDFNVNKNSEIFQCSCCGSIHKVDRKYKPQGYNIYVTLWCEKCKKCTTQLYCGDDEDGIYEFYDVNIDPRIY